MRFFRTCGLVIAALAVAGVVCADSAIYLGPESTDIERQAAVELQRYLYLRNEQLMAVQIVGTLPEDAAGVVIGTPDSLPSMAGESWPFGLEAPRHDGYILHTVRESKPLVVVAGMAPEGARNGAYGLLESLGFGFYLGGETYPDVKPDVPVYHESVTPVFQVRGTVPWHNFFSGPSAWELPDYRAYIDNLVQMRCNFVAFHSYDTDPFAAYPWKGEMVGGDPLPNTSRPNWGTTPLSTDQFFAGTGQYFAREHFGAASSFIEDRDAAIDGGKEVLRSAMLYAKSRGLKVGLGFEANGDPFDPETQARFQARLTGVLDYYPVLDTVWVWEGEALSLHPRTTPRPRTQWDSYTRRWEDAFASAGEHKRQAEAVRMTVFGLLAKDVLVARDSGPTLVMSGWGGDQWLRFTDFYAGMDKILPKDVIFSALDNMPVSSSVSNAYGSMSTGRRCWPIIWLEFDGDLWMPQPNLEAVAGACRDALAKGCPGLLGIHWRTRDVAGAAGYQAAFAWNPDLTVDQFIERRVRHLFGSQLAEAAIPTATRLQQLGYRWVGGWGQNENGVFSWQPGEEERRTELVQIAFEMREELRRMGLLGGIIPDFLPSLTTVGVIPDAVPDLTGELRDRLLPARIMPRNRAALADGIRSVEYVLDMDAAATALQAGGGLDELIDEEQTDLALTRIKESRFAEAAHIYGQRIRNKGELGVLATMNTKAWADLRERTYLEGEALAPLEQLPESMESDPGILVLPDRVIVTGADPDRVKVTLKARELGTWRFRTRRLTPMGGTTFALEFPADLSRASNVEFGLEVKGARGRLTWPEEFPKQTVTATIHSGVYTPTGSGPAASAGDVKPVAVAVKVVPDRHVAQLSWEPVDGHLYTVSRNDVILGTVCDGWFEDEAPYSGSEIRYTVTARRLRDGKTAASELTTDIPELPLPQPPENIVATSRDGRVILGWDCNSPVAARYTISKLDDSNRTIEEIVVDGDYGQFIQATDKMPAGQVATYRIAGVAPDGRQGPPSRKIGVIASDVTAEPFVFLSFEDESFLEGLAQVADNALALGGKGWAELPSQPDWNPEDSLTISTWINLDTLYGMPVLVCKGTWLQSGYFVQVINQQVRFHVAGVDTIDAGEVKAGQWTHIAAVYGNGEMRLFLNGELAGRKRVSGDVAPDQSPLLLGRYGTGDDVYFVRGLMDDIRIYDVAFTADEIAEMYASTKRD
ncbi:MAG: hypothetical protein GY851_22835 [bacterium]|nr:hypothetical protein [bacterium]